MKACDALYLSPHPDDAEIFAGASAASLAAAGACVRFVDLSAGELSSNGTPQGRREESLRAVAALGVETDRPVLGLPDGALDARDVDQQAAVLACFREHRPRLIVAPWWEDRHPDHEAAGRLVQRAAARLAEARIHGDETVRLERVLYYPCHREVPVDVVVDVEAGMPAWRGAVACYSSQFQRAGAAAATPINRPGFLDAHEARRARWGLEMGWPFAEGFVHEGPVALDAATAMLRPERSPR